MIRNDEQYENYKKYLLETEKLKQEIKKLRNQNSDFKSTKVRANAAILISLFVLIVTLMQFLKELYSR